MWSSADIGLFTQRDVTAKLKAQNILCGKVDSFFIDTRKLQQFLKEVMFIEKNGRQRRVAFCFGFLTPSEPTPMHVIIFFCIN